MIWWLWFCVCFFFWSWPRSQFWSWFNSDPNSSSYSILMLILIFILIPNLINTLILNLIIVVNLVVMILILILTLIFNLHSNVLFWSFEYIIILNDSIAICILGVWMQVHCPVTSSLNPKDILLLRGNKLCRQSCTNNIANIKKKQKI